MTTAIEKLRAAVREWRDGKYDHDTENYIPSSATMAVIRAALDVAAADRTEADALRADRDRLAARVAELEAESVKRWRALQPLTDLLGMGLETGAWPNLIAALWQRVEGEPEANADPCPVHFGTLRDHLQVSGDTWGFDSKASAEALIDGLEWVARRVAGRGRP
jgi:hypothetical protein